MVFTRILALCTPAVPAFEVWNADSRCQSEGRKPFTGLPSNTISFPQPGKDCCHFQLLFAMKTMAPG